MGSLISKSCHLCCQLLLLLTTGWKLQEEAWPRTGQQRVGHGAQSHIRDGRLTLVPDCEKQMRGQMALLSLTGVKRSQDLHSGRRRMLQ